MKKIKKCSHCKSEKPISDFYKNNKTKDGYSYPCKSCIKIYQNKTKKHLKDYYKKYYEQNKKKLVQKYKKYYIKNRTKLLKQSKNYHLSHKNKYKNNRLLKNFGISLKEYKRLLKNQKSVCAICGKKEINLGFHGKIKNLSVDHDHNSKVIRGLLCDNCNHGIGCFKDNIKIMKKAIKYLEKHK